jgi:molybdate transport system substrate-binding protein
MTPRNRLVTGVIVAALVAMSLRCAMAEPLQVYAAGSLTAAFTDIVKAFPTAEGIVATPVFGPSGVLREKIEHGDHVDLLASADMEQPRTLARSRPGTFVVMFTRNRLCALGRVSVGLTSDNLLDRLLDPSVRLAHPPRALIPAATTHGRCSRGQRRCMQAHRPSCRPRP